MKQIQKTPFITGLLKGAVGEDVDTDKLPVWEVVATSSIPLRGKDGTIFEKAVIEPLTLFQLAAYVNRDPLPLMMDHNMGGEPFGKFFYAEVVPGDNGVQELRGYHYIDPTEEKKIQKVDNSTIDEVSIAFAAKEMKCSACGWDYRVALDADDIMPLVTRTCPNGHEIGKNGIHIRLNGVEEALELSLVSRGAAKNSKIVGQSTSKLGKQLERLAAHGLDINDYYVTASASKGLDDMDINDLVVQLADAKSNAKVAEGDRDRLRDELAKAVGERNEAETRVNQLESELREARQLADEAPTAEQKETARKDSEAKASATEFLKGQYTAVLTAAGKTDFDVPETVDELIAGITEHKAELSAILPIGGVTEASGTNHETEGKQDFTVFRARQNVQR